MLLGIFLYKTPLLLIILVLFISTFLFYFLGVIAGNYKKKYHPDAKAEGIGPLESALLGLLSLLLSFTFGISSSRYDTRRALIVQEANDIGTVILRSDMYPDSIRIQLRKELQEYVEKRISYYDATDDIALNQVYADAEKIAAHIWREVIVLSKTAPSFVRDNQMVPAVNAMMDVANNRDASRLARVPDLIIYLLISLTLLGSFIVGYGKKAKKNDWIILTMYSLMTIMTICTILDLDRPRRGNIRTNVPHEKIIRLRDYFSNNAGNI